VRCTGLLALVTFPLAVGLGALAPTLVGILLRPEWRDVGPMLAMLSALGILRPIGWTVSAYLVAKNRPRADAALELLKLSAVVAFLLTLGRLGPFWACAAVGLAFATHSLASVIVVQMTDGVAVVRVVSRCVGPLVACVPMAGAVIGVRYAFQGLGASFAPASLVAQVAAGGLVYLAAARVLAPSASMDLIAIVTSALRRRREPSVRETSPG
jgi:PST family polysaccharide transporter